MGRYKHWRHSLRLSIIIHCFLLVGIGFLSPLTLAVQPEHQVIELELTGYNQAPIAVATPAIQAKQVSANADSMAPDLSINSIKPRESRSNEQTVQGSAGEQYSSNANTNVAADYQTGSSETPLAGGKQAGNAVTSPVSAERSTVQPPRILQKVEPAYPEEARRQGLAGKVIIKLEVLTTGQVGSATIERSSGHELLDDAAVEAVRQWRFIPARESASGNAIRCVTTVPLVFRLM